MEVSAGRQAGGADRPDHIPSRDRLTLSHKGGRQVAVERAHMLIRSHDDVESRAGAIESNTGGATHRGVDSGSLGGREIDAGVYVPAGTERIDRLEIQCGAS